MKYRQCIFRSGSSRTVAWIDANVAREGHSVQLKDSDDPKRFWVILSVGSLELDEGKMNERRYREFQDSTRDGG